MSSRYTDYIAALFVALAATSCANIEDSTVEPTHNTREYGFDIKVTRDGKEVTADRYGVMTKAGAEGFDQYATMDPDRSFGLIGVDAQTGELLVDNQPVYSGAGGYGWISDGSAVASEDLLLSAYYPYKTTVAYNPSAMAYTIRFASEDTEEGPLVSKTMRQAIDRINRIPIEFQHVTNDLGFKICDVTPTEVLQGLIHVRKVIVHNVASAGFFVNDLAQNSGSWQGVGYYRDVLLFDGDAVVGVGSENEKFIGYDTLEDHLADSHRFYSVPDEIRLGVQYVEVIYDVDSFTMNNYTYEPVRGEVAKYALYGLLPDNVYVYGKQYTFHLGLDISPLYQEISFAPSVGEWETKIFENNDDF